MAYLEQFVDIHGELVGTLTSRERGEGGGRLQNGRRPFTRAVRGSARPCSQTTYNLRMLRARESVTWAIAALLNCCILEKYEPQAPTRRNTLIIVTL